MYTIEKQRLSIVRDTSVAITDKRATTPESVTEILGRLIGDSPAENFVVLALSAKHEVVGASIVALGDIGSAIVTPRQVFSYAMLVNARTIIVGHNHPSGDPTPSKDDRAMTKRLQEAGKILGVDLLDHVIIGHDHRGTGFNHYSFQEQGLI